MGSVIERSNDVSAIVSQIRYRAHGEERGHYNANGEGHTPNAADRHEWTGYEAEHEAGLSYAGARYYDPAIGQFLSHDPARQYASPYAYGPGDPVNGTDPSGESFLGFFGDLFKGLKRALGDAGDAVDRVLPSSVSMNVSVGYTHRFGEQGKTSQPGADRANPSDAIVRGYAMYGVSSRYAVYAAVVAMRNGGTAVGGPMVYGEDAFALAANGQAVAGGRTNGTTTLSIGYSLVAFGQYHADITARNPDALGADTKFSAGHLIGAEHLSGATSEGCRPFWDLARWECSSRRSRMYPGDSLTRVSRFQAVSRFPTHTPRSSRR